MPTYLHPGVYVEEIPSGSKPIEGVGTSTAAFIGFTTKGPMGEPTLISKWDDYDNEFGGIRNLKKDKAGDPMGLSVAAFYQNGGSKAYIVRITEDWKKKDSSIPHAEKAVGYVDHPTGSSTEAILFTAVNEGEWANGLVVKLSTSEIDSNLHNVEIGRYNDKGKFSPIENFADVSLDDSDPVFIKDVIDGVSELVTVDLVADVSEESMISDHYVGYTTSANLEGGSLDFSALNASQRQLQITLDDKPADTITLTDQNYASLDEVAAAIQKAMRAISPAGPDDSNERHTGFTCKHVDNRLILTSGSRKAKSAVVVNHSLGLGITLKLGIDSANAFIGSSTSGDLSTLTFPLALSDTALFPDAASRTLEGSVDWTDFSFVFPATDLADLNAVAGSITGAPELTCAVVSGRLELKSNTHTPSSAVVITSDVGIAPKLKLGKSPIDHGGAELTGQEHYEASLSHGTSTSGDLSTLTVPLALADTALFPNSDSRTIKYRLNGTDDSFVFPATNLGDLTAIAGAINGITGLECSKKGDRLELKSETSSPTSAVVIDPSFGIAPTLKLGVSPTNPQAVEKTGQENLDANLRTQLTGLQSANLTFPKDTLDGGADGGLPGPDDYDEVFTSFIKYRDINIICLPGQYWTKDSSGNSIVQKALGHAEKMKNRMVIVDPLPTHELENPKMVVDMELPSQTYCVVYYPWIEVANRFYHPERAPGLPKTVLVPPSGYAAGMWAKIDGKRGVWKAPAGTETGLLGLAGLEYKVEDDDQDSLNPWGVNCLRSMPGAGKVIWGSRTRATKADPEWRYVPVRRTAIMIEQSIYNGIQWAVFEPNDHRLWAALRGNIGGFMNSLFRVGMFQGEKASDAYFVRCGLGDTMTQTDIDAGQVIVIVGFAPLKPAEFVIVRIQQKVNQQ